MRQAIIDLINMGPLPSESNDDFSIFETYQENIDSITTLVTVEEAKALVLLFGDDGCYGLASSLIYLIESADGFNIEDYDALEGNIGIDSLRARASNAHNV